MKRLQIYYPDDLLEDLRLYAKSRGIPLAQALRTASKEFAQKPPIKKTIEEIKKRKFKTRKNPLFAMAGILKGGPTNASTTVDDIYNDWSSLCVYRQFSMDKLRYPHRF